MSVTKLKRDLMPPIAPLPPDTIQAGKPTGADDLAAPRSGELVSWSLNIEMFASPNDPFGHDAIQHVREYLRHRGFKVGPARLMIPATKVPRAIATTSTR